MNAVRPSRIILLSLAAGAAVFVLGGHFFSKPRILAVGEVPVAFWAWRNQAPSNAEVQNTFEKTNASTLFLRAGQFDRVSGSVERIRPVSGTLPSSVEIHLVYNGTRRFLSEWDEMESADIAAAVAETFQADSTRAANDHANVAGLQLDLDVPTRLLPKYAEALRHLRKFLPPETKLSITGLPTWTTSDEISAVLAAVDFWIPQCYGASIPTKATNRVPISSPSSVEHTIAAVRRLGKPFYAGLAAYSYAILYDTNGNSVELRGDIDPAEAARNDQLELVETQNFGVGDTAAELRYVYWAKGDLVLDGLIMRPGETLVFDLPSAASLQASARAVRENAGEMLLGICIFRLPTGDDGATLGPDEIAVALSDRSTDVITRVTLSPDTGNKLTLSAENKGTANTRLAEDAFTIDIRVPMGSIGGASAVAGFTSYETLCSRGGAETPRPCSDRRADVIRLRARSWRPGTTATVTFVVRNSLPATLPAAIQTRVDDGRIERETIEIKTGE